MKDKEHWCAAVHGVPKSETQLSDGTTTTTTSLLLKLKWIKRVQNIAFHKVSTLHTEKCLEYNFV